MTTGTPTKRLLRNNYFIGAVLLIVLIFSLRQYPLRSLPLSISSSPANVRPANSTLGFGGLYVVSRRGSPRRDNLLEAAAVTELELSIPEQVDWTEEDIRKFQTPDYNESKVLRGSVKAWLSHHLVLRAFLESGKETALIFEDDVDWDIRLRTQQVPLAQNAARSLLNRSSWTRVERHPWGSPEDWDLLYLGHCGDYFGPANEAVGVGHNHPEDLENIPHVLFEDPTMSWRTDLHPFTASLLSALHVPEQTRILHKSRWPLCTFGYAVNRRSAQLIMDKIAPAKEDERNLSAYDVAIMIGCLENKIRCYTLQPELFHHMEGESLIANVEADQREIFRPPVDAVGLEQTQYRRETSNIGCGFWSGDFYANGDDEKLQWLIREVGRKGQCLKEKVFVDTT